MSPEAYVDRASWSDLREVVESFYAAVRAGDADAVRELAQEHSQAVVDLYTRITHPDSLLDASRIRVEQVIEDPVEHDEHDEVVVAVSSGEPDAVRSLHWWTFERLRATEIRVFYSETARR